MIKYDNHVVGSSITAACLLCIVSACFINDW